MSAYQNRPRPFSKERTKATICKVIFFYSIFYVVMKAIAIFKGAWLLPNLILSIPLVIFGVIGFYMTKKNKFSWWYIIVGVFAISALRYYETDAMVWLQQNLTY